MHHSTARCIGGPHRFVHPGCDLFHGKPFNNGQLKCQPGFRRHIGFYGCRGAQEEFAAMLELKFASLKVVWIGSFFEEVLKRRTATSAILGLARQGVADCVLGNAS